MGVIQQGVNQLLGQAAILGGLAVHGYKQTDTFKGQEAARKAVALNKSVKKQGKTIDQTSFKGTQAEQSAKKAELTQQKFETAKAAHEASQEALRYGNVKVLKRDGIYSKTRESMMTSGEASDKTDENAAQDAMKEQDMKEEMNPETVTQVQNRNILPKGLQITFGDIIEHVKQRDNYHEFLASLKDTTIERPTLEITRKRETGGK